MSELTSPNVTPDKIYPYLKKADPEQLQTLYRLAHHLIRGSAPSSCDVSVSNFLLLLEDGSERQLLLIFQCAYHLVHRERIV